MEIKNSRIGDRTKVPHLSYIGDAVIGRIRSRHSDYGYVPLADRFNRDCSSERRIDSAAQADQDLRESAFADIIARPEHQLPGGQSFIAWFRGNEAELRENAALRAKNVIVARQLLPLFEAEPGSWDALCYLNLGKREQGKPLRQVFAGGGASAGAPRGSPDSPSPVAWARAWRPSSAP